ncbi:hypothetical protein PO909_025316 [Leuciscus waleckii]
MPQVIPRCSEEVKGEQLGKQEMTQTGPKLEVVVEGGYSLTAARLWAGNFTIPSISTNISSVTRN